MKDEKMYKDDGGDMLVNLDQETRAPPVIMVDYEKYEQYLETADLTEQQKQEYLQMLWSVICEFVSLGFGVHPLQQVESDCGQSSENGAQSTFITLDMLNYEHNQTREKFKDVADSKTQPQDGGVKE